jgi:signal transduction histidine kinase
LSVVLSSAEILERYLERLSLEERSMHVREIRMHAKRLAELVDEVLFLGRMDAGTVELHLAPVDLRATCREVVESVVTALAVERTVHIAIERTPSRVLLDERLVRHILSNLVHNALKYSPPDRPVWFTVSAEGSDLVLRVRDEGIGIPEQDQARMFQSFQRASNVGAISGSGLGLVVVKRCVEMHGGAIDLRSVVGKGTEFTVRLPLAIPEVRPEGKSSTKPRIRPAVRHRGKTRKPAARKR